MIWLLLACSGATAPDTGTDTSEPPEFCSVVADDGGRYELADGGGNTTGGSVSLRLLTTESDDANDPAWVAFKDYTLTDADNPGVPVTGTTSGDGLVDKIVGAGNWSFVAAYARGSTTCTAELEFPVEAGRTTQGCPVMTCPD